VTEATNVTGGVSIRIGGVDIDRARARSAAAQYLAAQGHRFGYPAYDAFDAGSGPFRVGDGDQLTPVLLNVPVSVKTFYSLSDLRPQLDAWLTKVPPDARLIDSSSDELALLGELFAVLDGGQRRPHLSGAVLAKVMHRKRPAFVPLYDRHVDHCYRGAPGAPITRDVRRPWSEFMPLLGLAMIQDLRREADYLAEVVAMATNPVITPLRALDIVAWQAGRSSGPKPGLWSNDVPDEFDDVEDTGENADPVDLDDSV
jgi:hypothetical protein